MSDTEKPKTSLWQQAIKNIDSHQAAVELARRSETPQATADQTMSRYIDRASETLEAYLKSEEGAARTTASPRIKKTHRDCVL